MTTIPPDDDGQRLDRWLKKKFPDLAFGALQKLLRTGQIRVDGKRAKPDTRLQAGQELRLPPQIAIPEVAAKTATEKDRYFLQSLVIYDDDDIVAINKPSGLAVQGGSGITRHVDGLLDGLTGKNGIRPRLVHRLDRDTSGILLLARSAEVARRLADTFSGRDIEKIYVAITAPAPSKNKGRVDAPLVKAMAGDDLEKVITDDDIGKPAITDYEVLARNPDSTAALVRFHPLTGRTHQIRVHAALLGCPLWGDIKYGAKSGKKFHLHATGLRLQHPKSGQDLVLSCPPPPDFTARCKALLISQTDG